MTATDLATRPSLRPPATVADSLAALSGGLVTDAPATGPVFRGTSAPRRVVRPDTFQPLLSRSVRLLIAGLTGAWLVSLVLFWTWWLQPSHRISVIGLVVNSSLLAYLSVQPAYFFVAINRLRRVNPAMGTRTLRTAFIVTRAPSEPWNIARTTLTAMLGQAFAEPYDVWLCDEDPSSATRQWCLDHDVNVSSRYGVSAYHRAAWPRRTKCKEGNLAYFYDQWGYETYDVVAQLDCDHVPSPTYLAEVVRPFADPAIGYVGAPSVCDVNADTSWSARGRLHREAVFQGAVQLGYANGLAPIAIGSHYAVRTAALRDIGGLGPELAEDFSTSFLMNSAGWHGAFALEAEAHGDGPITFAAMTTQEFQWARSLTSTLYDLAPRHLPRLPWRLRIRFLFALTLYGILALTTLVGLCLPPVAAVTGIAWINVNYLQFLGHWWLVSLWCVMLTVLLRRHRLLRPQQAPIVSWELWLYALTRWPFVAFGVFAATRQRLWPRSLVLKVTPKSRDGLEPLGVRRVLPFLSITVVLSCAAVVGELTSHPAGYVGLCILGATTYAVVGVAVSALHAVETARAAGLGVRSVLRTTVGVPLLASTAALLPLSAALALLPSFLSRVLGW